MAKPYIHAKSSCRKYKGEVSDYLPIHNMMDLTKASFGDSRHRTIFHTTFGVFVMEKIFGIDFEFLKNLAKKHNWSQEEINDIISFKQHCIEHGTCLKNSDGLNVSVRDVAEQHVLEDFRGKFIPTPQDFLQEMEIRPWMLNGVHGVPPSFERIENKKTITTKEENDI